MTSFKSPNATSRPIFIKRTILKLKEIVLDSAVIKFLTFTNVNLQRLIYVDVLSQNKFLQKT